MTDDGKTVQVRLNGPELARLQSLADEHHDGSLSSAIRSLIVSASDTEGGMVYRFTDSGARYIRDLADRRGGASRDADEPCTVEDTIARALHLGCGHVERAVTARGPKRLGAGMVIGRQLGRLDEAS